MSTMNPNKKKRMSGLKSSSSASKKFSPSWILTHYNDAPGFNLELIENIRSGVQKSDWKQLLTDIELTEKELEKILPSSISSMQKKTKYDRETSERIFELARLFGLGHEVFDSNSDFINWLFSQSKTLGNMKPFELLDSSLGFKIVENEILRIQHNVYA